MYRLLIALVASLLLSSSALAVDPPLYVQHGNHSFNVVEFDALLTEENGLFYGTVTYDNGYQRKWVLGPTNTSKNLAIWQMLLANAAAGDKVIRVEGLPLQSYVKPGSGAASVNFLVLIDAKLVE